MLLSKEDCIGKGYTASRISVLLLVQIEDRNEKDKEIVKKRKKKRKNNSVLYCSTFRDDEDKEE